MPAKLTMDGEIWRCLLRVHQSADRILRPPLFRDYSWVPRNYCKARLFSKWVSRLFYSSESEAFESLVYKPWRLIVSAFTKWPWKVLLTIGVHKNNRGGLMPRVRMALWSPSVSFQSGSNGANHPSFSARQNYFEYTLIRIPVATIVPCYHRNKITWGFSQ